MALDQLPLVAAPRADQARVERCHLPGEPASVPAARRFVRQVLTAWAREDLLESGALLSSELVTNAVLHARTPVVVELVQGGQGVLLVVSDRSPALPVRRRHSRVSGTGRGLWLLDTCSLRHGVVPTEDGKQVWSELRPEEPEDADADPGALASWLDGTDGL